MASFDIDSADESNVDSFDMQSAEASNVTSFDRNSMEQSEVVSSDRNSVEQSKVASFDRNSVKKRTHLIARSCTRGSPPFGSLTTLSPVPRSGHDMHDHQLEDGFNFPA